MSLWKCFKLKLYEILSGTRAEYRPGKTEVSDANEYVINGVRYVVSTRFSKTENKTMKEKISAFIGSDFAHLTKTQDKNTMNAEYVCLTAGKED